MHLKLRAKANGRLEVLDEAGKPVRGIQRVELFCDLAHPVPQVRITLSTEVEIDAIADARQAIAPQEGESSRAAVLED